jgi:hypothetical protein
MTDLPDLKHDSKIVQVAQAGQLDPSVESLFNRTFQSPPKQKGGDVISTGQIQALPVPKGWEQRPEVKLPAGAGLTEYHAPGHDNIRLNSFYRGARVSEDAAKAFKACLAKAPHQLQDNEIKSLTEVLRDKAQDFDISAAATKDLNGKRVLGVEGSYRDAAHTTSQTLYVDADGSGSVVQEVSYTASGKDYPAHMNEAVKALQGIVWK